MEYLVAVILGVIVAGFAATTGFDRDRSFYPTVLIVVGSYYALFAVMGASGYASLGIEVAVGLVFSGFAVLGFQLAILPPAVRKYKIKQLSFFGWRLILEQNGGTIALWPLVKALLAKDDTVMREFWHAKLSEMNPAWVTGTAESMAGEPDRSDELVAASIPPLSLPPTITRTTVNSLSAIESRKEPLQ